MPTLGSNSANITAINMTDTTAPANPDAGENKIYFKSGTMYKINSAGTETPFATGSGDVVGPASATANAVALFDGTTGKLLKDSALVIAAGTYTPTLTNTTNIAASTAYQCQYLQIGNVVTVSGVCNIDATSTGSVVLGISLPVASNIGNNYELAGVGANAVAVGNVCRIVGDATNDRATLTFTAVDVSNLLYSFTFTYLVI